MIAPKGLSRRASICGLLIAAPGVLGQYGAAADAAANPCGLHPGVTCGSAIDDNFSLSGDKAQGRGVAAAPGRAAARSVIAGPLVVRTLAPACSGNTPADAGLTCGRGYDGLSQAG